MFTGSINNYLGKKKVLCKINQILGGRELHRTSLDIIYLKNSHIYQNRFNIHLSVCPFRGPIKTTVKHELLVRK